MNSIARKDKIGFINAIENMEMRQMKKNKINKFTIIMLKQVYGFWKSTHSEGITENTQKAEIVSTNVKRRIEDTLIGEPEEPKANKLTSLTTLLEDIQSSKEKWPKEALLKVLGWFGRMPRTGLFHALTTYFSNFHFKCLLRTLRKRHRTPWLHNQAENARLEISSKRLSSALKR